MVTSQELLSSLLNTVQLNQHILRLSAAASSSHALKSILVSLIQEYDRIESEIQIISAQRGWELYESEPAARWLSGFRFRHSIQKRRADSSIAEYMIGLHTKDMVQSLKLHNQCNRTDEQIQTLFQKFLDCKTISIRQMQPFL